jgi:glutamate racemase
LTRAGVNRLFDLGCGLVIIACNTAAAVALRQLQQDWLPAAWPDGRLLGVFVPMVEAVTGIPWQRTLGHCRGNRPVRTVGVFATTRTVLTCAWRREIRTRAPGVAVVQQQCPGLAGLIERGTPSADIDAAVRRFTAGLLGRLDKAPDAVVLGCTHYPLIVDRFSAALPPETRILDQPGAVARSLAGYLERHPGYDAVGGSGRVRYHTTGDTGAARGLATRFLGAPVTFLPIGRDPGAGHQQRQLISAGGAP